ncbi:MAG: YebC/PmpR family DNA-binding transcriptional regulator [Gammaproteobacteria bacterium]|nr:YebC/PmpR family DNA-binding transcriptional regulator [Gammaproteobacteria bacterium]NNC97161.1 YebC/PmpR family DNA-binding transcriptional regulator [Gammaproteobacteria bacterium]NNM13949.1 YebC/PmpR family DNA-binding transcriptional regulator [Gammaproteobacteria bacterium]
MAGHSKWANIQHRKGAQDKKRAKVFTRLIREVVVAAKMGGSDPDANPRLRLALTKARGKSVPKDSIERAVKRGAGELDGDDYEEIRYEGYGPGGAAVMVDCLSDNRNRTVADVRHAFTKYNGQLGTDGSVSFMFSHEGVITYAPGTDEYTVMEAALEAGAEDIVTNEDGSIDVITEPNSFADVLEALEKTGLEASNSEVTYRPSNNTMLDDKKADSMMKLLDKLEELDDVQEVYTNADFSPEFLANLESE